MEGTCQFCSNLPGCTYLGDSYGRFIPERVITEDNFRECEGFELVGDREKWGIRERLYLMSGLGYLRALHELPAIVMDGLRQGEKDELMYEDIPDFQDARLLYEGMPVPEREEVLRYETDEDGNVIVDVDDEGVGVKRARPTYHLKHYATLEDGPIQLDKSVCWFWTTNQLVDHILRTEVSDGLIIKVKAKGGQKASPKKPQQARETKMADGKRVRVNRSAGKAKPKGKAAPAAEGGETRRAAPKGATGGGRVARPPVRKPGGKAAPAETEAPAASGGGGSINIDAFEKSIAKIIDDRVGDIMTELKEVKAQLAETRQSFVDAITIFHDIMAQTGGTLQYPQEDEEGNVVVDEDGMEIMENGPELYPKESKIFAYLDGTAFEPEEDAGDDSGE